MIATDISADTQAIVEQLSAVPRGELVTLDALSAALGRDIGAARWLLYSALRIVERESGAVFATERGKGYRRLTPDEIAKIGQTARSRIRSMARRGSRSIAAGITGANDIAPAAMRAILAEQSALGLLEHIARDKNLPAIAETETRALPVAKVAREFLRHIGAKTEPNDNDDRLGS